MWNLTVSVPDYCLFNYVFATFQLLVLRVLDTEANKFYDMNHQLYDAALLTDVILNMLSVHVSILKQITNGTS